MTPSPNNFQGNKATTVAPNLNFPMTATSDELQPQPHPTITLAPALSTARRQRQWQCAEYVNISIMHNKFLSAISYEPTIVEVANENILKESRQSFHFPSNPGLTIYQLGSTPMK